MITYDEIIQKLKAIRARGYVKTQRKGDEGIGRTLEYLLGVKENNVPGPNAGIYELKSARKTTSSMLSLFTKSPLPRGTNPSLRERYGYESERSKKRKILHTTINAVAFNSIKGGAGFKIDIEPNRINLINNENEILGYWDYEKLRELLEIKLNHVLYVKAEVKGSGKEEAFWYNEAWLLTGLSLESFLNLLKEGMILVDIRIGLYSTGKTHDHGTAFRIPRISRISPDKFVLSYKNREKIM